MIMRVTLSGFKSSTADYAEVNMGKRDEFHAISSLCTAEVDPSSYARVHADSIGSMQMKCLANPSDAPFKVMSPRRSSVVAPESIA